MTIVNLNYYGGQFALSAHTPHSAISKSGVYIEFIEISPHCGVTATIAAAVFASYKTNVEKKISAIFAT